MEPEKILSRLYYLRDVVPNLTDPVKINEFQIEISQLEIVVKEIVDVHKRNELRKQLEVKLDFLQWMINRCNDLPEKYHPGRLKQWWKLRTNPVEVIDRMLNLLAPGGHEADVVADMKKLDGQLEIVAGMVMNAQKNAGVGLNLVDEVDLRLYDLNKQRDPGYQIVLDDYKRQTLLQKWVRIRDHLSQ